MDTGNVKESIDKVLEDNPLDYPEEQRKIVQTNILLDFEDRLNDYENWVKMFNGSLAKFQSDLAMMRRALKRAGIIVKWKEEDEGEVEE